MTRTGSDALRWYSAPGGWIATDHEHETVVRVIGVEYGWDVWVVELYCGTYLTAEMARGAGIGILHIVRHGSTLPRWAGPGRG